MTPPSILPSLRGQLSDTSIGELLALALDRKLSGSVLFETPLGAKHVLVLEAGRATKAQTGEEEEEVAEPIARHVAWLGGLPPTTKFAYYGRVDLLAHTPASTADPLALLWRSIRGAAETHPRQREVLESLAGGWLELSPDATPQRFALSADEQQLLDLLRAGAVSLAALLSARVIEEERARRLVYTLQLTHQLIVRAGAPSHRGVSSSARAAMPSLVTSELPSQGRIEQALERATRRARAQDDSVRLSQAAHAYQSALSCIARKRLGEAASFARVASDTEPGNPEYLALHAWLRIHTGAPATPAQAAQIMGALDRAVMKARESVSIRFYRAQVLKRLGRQEEAFKDFRFVARREPNNLDAVREVRLHLMRTRNAGKVSGVFSKLFLR